MELRLFVKFVNISIILLVILSLSNPANSNSINYEDYPLLKLKWKFPVGSDDVYAFDFDRDGKIEVYSSKYDIVRSYLYVLNLDGNLMYKTWVDKVAEKKLIGCGAPERHAREKIMYFLPANIDNDNNLDIIAGSSMKGTALVEERVYYFEMEESVIGTHKTRYRWDYQMGDIPSKAIVMNGKIVVASLDSNLYVFDMYGGLIERYKTGGAIWDISLKDRSTLDGAVLGTFKGIYRIDGNEAKLILSTNERVFKVDTGNADTDNQDDIVALMEDGNFIMLDRNMNIIWKRRMENPIDVKILEFESSNFARTLIASDGIIYSVDENGNLNVEYILGEHINSMYVFSQSGNSRYVIIGTSSSVYFFEINPDFSVYMDGRYYLKNARYYYLSERNCNKAIKYADKCYELFQDIDYFEGVLKCYLISSECRTIPTSENKSEKAMKFYNDADDLMKRGKYETALAYAEISLDLFFDANDKDGILKADSLILSIKNAWRGEANNLYSSAIGFLDSGNYSSAIEYANSAKYIYTKLNDTLGITKTAVIIKRAQSTIYANENLKNAEVCFKKGDYHNATVYAEIARESYLSLGYEEEAKMADYIRNKSIKYREAKEHFDKALKYLNLEDLQNATIYVNLSRNIYIQLDDKKRIAECDLLLKRIEDIKIRRRNQEQLNLYIQVGIIILLIMIPALIYYTIKRRKG